MMDFSPLPWGEGGESSESGEGVFNGQGESSAFNNLLLRLRCVVRRYGVPLR
jgi:hypothetical protein